MWYPLRVSQADVTQVKNLKCAGCKVGGKKLPFGSIPEICMYPHVCPHLRTGACKYQKIGMSTHWVFGAPNIVNGGEVSRINYGPRVISEASFLIYRFDLKIPIFG